VQVDALAVRLRPRSAMEAADLGASLCRDAAGSVYRAYAVVAIPTICAALASYRLAHWLPVLLIWWAKPWLDRTILFALSRAAFGQRTSMTDLWRDQYDVWWRQLPAALTLRRLSPWRVLTQPAYQIEGSSFFEARRRARQIRSRTMWQAWLVGCAFTFAELAVTMSWFSLTFWMAPEGASPDLFTLFTADGANPLLFVFWLSYAAAVLCLEPFYVAAGFAMYLNRRADLEAWDIEQEFRRAFGR